MKLSNLWRVIWLVKIFRVSCQIQNESCHPNLACSASCGNGGGWGESGMDGSQMGGKQNKTKVLCLQKFPHRNKTPANSTTGACIFLMSAT